MSPTRVGWRKAMLSMEAVSRCRPPRPTRLAAMYAACSIQRITCPAGSGGHADHWKPTASAQRLAQLAALYAACSIHCITCLAGQGFGRQNICQAQAKQAHSRLPAALYSAMLKAQEVYGSRCAHRRRRPRTSEGDAEAVGVLRHDELRHVRRRRARRHRHRAALPPHLRHQRCD